MLEDRLKRLQIMASIYSHLGGSWRQKYGFSLAAIICLQGKLSLSSFAQVSKRFRDVARLGSARAMWLMNTYGKQEALYYAVWIGHIVDASTLDYLIDTLGAHASRYCELAHVL